MRKKRKKETIAKINRRLFKKWSEAVRARDNFTCQYCGIKRGDLLNNKTAKIDAHHILPRAIKDNPLKFDIQNGISLCPKHHKFSTSESFHKNPLIMLEWFKSKYPVRYNYLLANYDARVDLNNKDILYNIEYDLSNSGNNY